MLKGPSKLRIETLKCLRIVCVYDVYGVLTDKYSYFCRILLQKTEHPGEAAGGRVSRPQGMEGGGAERERGRGADG